jgi:hypothetical protein
MVVCAYAAVVVVVTKTAAAAATITANADTANVVDVIAVEFLVIVNSYLRYKI